MWGAQGTIARPNNQEKRGFLTIGTWFLLWNWPCFLHFSFEACIFFTFQFQFFWFLGWYFLYHDHCAVCCNTNSISNPRVSVCGSCITWRPFACFCWGFNFYDVKKHYYFSKREGKYFYIFNHFYVQIYYYDLQSVEINVQSPPKWINS